MSLVWLLIKFGLAVFLARLVVALLQAGWSLVVFPFVPRELRAEITAGLDVQHWSRTLALVGSGLIAVAAALFMGLVVALAVKVSVASRPAAWFPVWYVVAGIEVAVSLIGRPDPNTLKTAFSALAFLGGVAAFLGAAIWMTSTAVPAVGSVAAWLAV